MKRPTFPTNLRHGRGRTSSGFTLIEIVVAMVILAAMMALLYSGLTFALRSWDAGDASGRKAADRRIGENFLRRELTEMFPMRWKDATVVRLALEAEPHRLRFVSSRPAGLQAGGLSLVGIEIEEGDDRRRHLTMRRAMPDDDANDFSPLDKAERNVLLSDVDAVEFDYFGNESDFTDPTWVNSWTYPGRLPMLVRVRVKLADGTALPEFVTRVMLGEEAGCLENVFQRLCRPRRPTR